MLGLFLLPACCWGADGFFYSSEEVFYTPSLGYNSLRTQDSSFAPLGTGALWFLVLRLLKASPSFCIGFYMAARDYTVSLEIWAAWATTCQEPATS